MKTELSVMKVCCTHDMVGKDIMVVSTKKSWSDFQSLPYGEKMAAKISHGGKHNLERHDLYWACVALVSENLELTTRQVVETCKIDCRWFDGFAEYKDKNGRPRINVITKSIAFSEMTLAEAEEYYSKAFDVLAGYLQTETELMIEEAKSRMRNPHYCKICGKKAYQKHHRFSQTKQNIAKYGKDMINAEWNIIWMCVDCHSSHNKITHEHNMTEKQFIEEMKKREKREKNIEKK